jgi:hypothetical protein
VKGDAGQHGNALVGSEEDVPEDSENQAGGGIRLPPTASQPASGEDFRGEPSCQALVCSNPRSRRWRVRDRTPPREWRPAVK